MDDLTEFDKGIIEERDNYIQALKCIREVLDGFNAFLGYTSKQYSDALEQINDILEKQNL